MSIERDESERRRLALVKLIAFERDETDLRIEIERERAEQALATRGDFLAMVSHDLRALLGGIALSAELLKTIDGSGDPMVKVVSYAERIQRFSARMNRLVGDLMDVASIDSGKLALGLARRDAALLLVDSMDAFEPAALAHGVSLTCERVSDLGAVACDHERILQVLANLVGNAFKFTPRGGQIVIRCERRDDELCFVVSDNGQGIPRDLLETIFTRYFQTIDGDRRGLGLGLFISKSIVEGHGGRIWAESTVGEGSTFYFTLPALGASDGHSA
jgi:signal transduction histidine kinase